MTARDHVWILARPDERYHSCKTCGVVKRADGKNNPCKGPTRIALRENFPASKAYLEELAWTCPCGTAMSLEILARAGGSFDLDCRQCGIVGSVSIRLGPTSLRKLENKS